MGGGQKAGCGRKTDAVSFSNCVMAGEPEHYQHDRTRTKSPHTCQAGIHFQGSLCPIRHTGIKRIIQKYTESAEKTHNFHVTVSCDYPEPYVSAKLAANPLKQPMNC
jgi:hypothetical protein